jgi:hypothetical protein
MWKGGYYLSPSKWRNPWLKELKAGEITLEECKAL